MKLNRSFSLSLVVALGALPLFTQGCAADGTTPAEEATATESQALAKDTTAASPATDVVVEPGDANLKILSAGEGWKRAIVTGEAEDTATGTMKMANEEIVILTHEEGIDNAPLSPKTKAHLHAESKLPSLKPAVIGKGFAPDKTPAADEDLMTVVSLAAAAEAEANEASGTAFFSCSDYDSSYSRNVNVDRSASFHKGNETGSFTGVLDFDARFAGSASATVRYRVGKKWCIPYKATFKKLEVVGNASLTGKVNVNGKFEKAWKYDRTIAKPEIASFRFWAGPVPIILKIRIPVEAGVDAKAKAELYANARVVGNGSFNVACSSSSCSGSKSATLSFTQDTPPTLSVNAKVDVTPYVSAALRGVLYGEDIAYGDVGVRGSLPASLWGYAGNGCGDANGDGSNEWVNAATLDLRAKADIFARVDTIFTAKREWTWNVANRSIGFWDLGDSSALDPIFFAENVSGTSATLRGRMRPCWPYTDEMRYRITWDDGSTEIVDAAPSTLFSKAHDFGSYGSKVVKLEALLDDAGRDANGSTTRSLYLRRFGDTLPVDPPILTER